MTSGQLATTTRQQPLLRRKRARSTQRQRLTFQDPFRVSQLADMTHPDRVKGTLSATTEPTDTRTAQSIIGCANARPPERCNTSGRMLFTREPLPATATTSTWNNRNSPAEPQRSPWLTDPNLIARRLWLALTLVAALFTLGACSTTQLAYNQAPKLLFWWLDGYVDFNGAQSELARQDIDAFLSWHRSTELPTYARQLQQWQMLAKQDISPAQACAQFDTVRAAVQRASERGLEPLARLALRLTPDQQAHLQRHQSKSNESFEEDFLRGSPGQRLRQRLDKAVGRYEMLYGRLSSTQRELLQNSLQQSPWDAQRTQQERLRRQTDLRQTVQAVQAVQRMAGVVEANGAGHGNGPVDAAALDASRSYLARVMNSPTPGYSAYSQTQVQHGCDQFAALHNTTTPEQRTNAVRVLKAYEDDLRALVAQR